MGRAGPAWPGSLSGSGEGQRSRESSDCGRFSLSRWRTKRAPAIGMGSVLSGESRAAAAAPQGDPCFDCAICLQVLYQPVRTRCGHVFCHDCIARSLSNSMNACPYCRTHLSSEGTPASDIVKKMKTVYQNCEECAEKVCLSEMRDHFNICQIYIEKYGQLEELVKAASSTSRYTCPYCHEELDEDRLMDHCLAYHGAERRLVMCPICRLMPGGDPSYMRSFLRHLHFRHADHYEDYIFFGFTTSSRRAFHLLPSPGRNIF
ncbi:E3 ubiquitin-protein ligase RNF125-like isoform X2 [Rhinatrema bivittatum]|uniref:E3 ubiquitin-protein ligase RNF125-like isoform X2 n=1 Tax=Rhinatrema bivittatum TaxID=194408 RepID=UPI00112B98B0|nr:E3 ubiquitin-protein ligase RNF125-like isoform X2 [Rhinatrema bivittatum]